MSKRCVGILFTVSAICFISFAVHLLLPTPTESDPLVAKPDEERDLIARASFRVNGGEDLDQRASDGSTLLHEAANRGFVRAVEYLLDNGARVDTTDWLGETPLHRAARAARCHDGSANAARMVEMLLERGARVDVRDCFKQTPLHDAAAWGRTDALDLLLEAGGQVNAVDRFGDTPLIVAAAYGHVDAVEKLLENGASVSMRNHFGATATHDVARVLAWNAQWRGDALVDLLDQHGADLNARDNRGMTPLDIARRRGEQSMVDRLRQAGALHAHEME